MADINTYALGLEFQLQAQPAIDAINKMISTAGDLTNALSKASKALDVGPQIFDYEEVIKVQKAFELKTLAATTAAVRLNQALTEGSGTTFQSAEAEKAYNKKIQELREELKLTNKEIKSFYKENKQYADFLKKEKRTHDERQLTFKKQRQTINENGEELKKQFGPLKAFGGWLGSLSDETQAFAKVLGGLSGQYGIFGGVLAFLAIGFKDIMDLQDAYRMASMRLIGTQESLIKSSLTLSQTLGASSKEAIETLTALAAVGYTATDAINDLANANFKFAKVTGVAASTTARYQRTLSMMGLDTKQSTRALGDMAAIMRNTGLTASQLDGLMKDLSKTMIELKLSFDSKSIVEFAGSLAKVAGAAQAAGVDGGALQKMLTDMATDVFDNVQTWNTFGVVVSQNMDIAKSTRTALANMGPVIRQLTKDNGILTTTILEGRGVPKAAAAEILAMVEAADKAGMTFEQYIDSSKKAVDLDADFRAATATLTEQLKQLLVPIMKLASVIMSALVPAITSFVSWITPIVTGLRDWWTQLEKTHPAIAQVISILLKGGIIIGAVAGGVVMLAGVFMKLGKSILSIVSPLSSAAKAMTIARNSSAGAGAGVRSFLINLAAGLKALGSPQAMKGAITLGILALAVAGTLVLVAYAMGKFGVSGKDMILGATAMVIAAAAVVILSFALKQLANAGPKVAIAGAIIIGVLLALGVATLLAGLGIGFMAKGLAELFKAIPDLWTFVVVIGALVLAMPTLAVGIAILGISLAASAPLILFGMILLAAAAYLASKVVIPALVELGGAILVIGTALAAVGPDAGLKLVGLALGITAFMAALLGIAAGGAVAGLGKLFGVKSPLAQAQEIAAAMATIAAPASMLGSSLDKLAKIGDIFKPFVEGVLGRKEELAEAATVIMALATQIDAARKAIGEGIIASPFAPNTFTTPVRKPQITEDTARKVRDARTQSMMLDSANATNESLKEVVSKLDANDGMKILINLLKEWLPKLSAEEKESGGLASAANQWM